MMAYAIFISYKRVAYAHTFAEACEIAELRSMLTGLRATVSRNDACKYTDLAVFVSSSIHGVAL